ncbi:MAG: bifunctional shikimate kinase/shikimate dehydrogenase, partial [Methanoregulaceae archaeon]|nr:bifunctional shikimate kinase/shikimate dehydrogenase [Methanoregulaceae archaeon]
MILCGFRGTGKTRTGVLLARLLGLPFFDTDKIIEEQSRMPIHEIFSTFGETEFRARECRVIGSLPVGDCVIATGGGAILDPGNVARLRRGGVVFLLQAEAATIESRIAATERPPLTKLPLREEIRELLQVRARAYRGAADFCVDTDRKDANEVALVIQRILTEGSVDRARKNAGILFLSGTGLPVSELRELESTLIGPAADPLTRLYGIAGNPCGHSKSPPLFNALFGEYGINSHYTRLCWKDCAEVVHNARFLDFRGLSVTIPFKEEILKYCAEIDADARAIGAANTIVFCGGKAFASNTDWIGIRDPLQHRRGARAVVLGAGGAAAAAVYALRSLDMDITILNRTMERGEKLASRFGCRSAPPDDFGKILPEVVVNTTPVGMAPDDTSP